MLKLYYVSQYNMDWDCVVCHKKIPAEQIPGPPGVILYQPSSRYWLPPIEPGITRGVFCSPECSSLYTTSGSKIHIEIQDKLFPVANNENPEGLSGGCEVLTL